MQKYIPFARRRKQPLVFLFKSTVLLFLFLLPSTLGYYNPEGLWIPNNLTEYLATVTMEDFLQNPIFKINGIHSAEEFQGQICNNQAVFGAYQAAEGDTITWTLEDLPSHWGFQATMYAWHLDTWDSEYSQFYWNNGGKWNNSVYWYSHYKHHSLSACARTEYKDAYTLWQTPVLMHALEDLALGVWGDLDQGRDNESMGIAHVRVYLGVCHPGCRPESGCSGSSNRKCKGDECAEGYHKVDDSCVSQRFSLHHGFTEGVTFLEGHWSIGTQVYTSDHTFPGGNCFGIPTFGLGDTTGAKADIRLEVPINQVHGQIMVQFEAVMIDWGQYGEVKFFVGDELVYTLEGHPPKETLTNGCGSGTTDKVNYVTLGPLSHGTDNVIIRIVSDLQVGIRNLKIFSADCHSSCQSCTGNTDDLCLTCAEGHLPHHDNRSQEEYTCKLHDDHSIDGCSPGYFMDEGICQKCHSSCLTCGSAKNDSCLTCYSGHLFHVGVVDASRGSCFPTEDTNDGCQEGSSLDNKMCIWECSPDDVSQRNDIRVWLSQQNNPDFRGELNSGSLEVALIFSKPSKCIQETLKIKVFSSNHKIALGEEITVSPTDSWIVKTAIHTEDIKNVQICQKTLDAKVAEYSCEISFLALVEGESHLQDWQQPFTVLLQDEIIISTNVKPETVKLPDQEIQVNLSLSLLDENGNSTEQIPEVFYYQSPVTLKITPPEVFNGDVSVSLVKVDQTDEQLGSATYGDTLNATSVSEVSDILPDGSCTVTFPFLRISTNLKVTIEIDWEFTSGIESSRILEEESYLVSYFFTVPVDELSTETTLEVEEESAQDSDDGISLDPIIGILALVIVTLILIGVVGFCWMRNKMKRERTKKKGGEAYNAPQETCETMRV